MFKWIGKILVWVIGTFLHLWSFGVMYFLSFPENKTLSKISAIAYMVIIALFVILSKKKTRAFAISLIAYFVVLVHFISIKPATGGVYPDNLVMPHAEVNGSLVTMHDVRNCNYRSKNDFDVHYETRTYDINKLKTLDVFVNYWGREPLVHTFLSFGFEGDEYVAVSMEIRPEKGESYGDFAGPFKQYEIIYIWADERDVVALRSNYRREDVYLYRTNLDHEEVSKLFLNMVKRTNSLYKSPKFYNTVNDNCSIANELRWASGKVSFSGKRKLIGTEDEIIYHEGWLDADTSFGELRKTSLINDRAKAAEKDKDFSEKIRTHLP